MTDPIHIMLIEDTPAYRKVVALALRDEEDLELREEFGTAEMALRRLQKITPAEQPDVILLDLRLPGMDGLEAMRWIQQYAPDTRILILTQSDKEKDVLKAVKQGTNGYLLKSASVREINDGIRNIMKGGASLGSEVSKLVMASLSDRIPGGDSPHELSPRELETLRQMAHGLSKKQIADQLNIGYTTVDTFVKKIYDKFDVNNAAAAISKGYNLGLIPMKK